MGQELGLEKMRVRVGKWLTVLNKVYLRVSVGLIREVQAVLSRAGKRPEPRKLNN